MPKETARCLESSGVMRGHPLVEDVGPSNTNKLCCIQVNSPEQQAKALQMHVMCADRLLQQPKCTQCGISFEKRRFEEIKDCLTKKSDHSCYGIDLLKASEQPVGPMHAMPPPGSAPPGGPPFAAIPVTDNMGSVPPAATLVSNGVPPAQPPPASNDQRRKIPQLASPEDWSRTARHQRHHNKRQTPWTERIVRGALFIGGMAITVLLLQRAGLIPSFQTLKSMYADKRNAIKALPSNDSWLASNLKRIQERFKYAFTPETPSQLHKSAEATSSFVKKAFSPEVTPRHAYYPQLKNALGQRVY